MSSTSGCGAPTPTAELPRRQLEGVLDMLDGRYPSSEFGRAAPADRVGPHRGHDPPAQGRARAGGGERGHDPRSGALPGDAARRAAGGGARRGDGVRGAAGAGLPAGGLGVADRGDRPRPRDRHARAGRAGGGAVLEGRGGGPPQRAGGGDRGVCALGGGAVRGGAGARVRPRCPRGAQPGGVPARAAGRHARAAQRPRDRGRALPRRDRRLAGVRALPLRRAHPLGVGPGALGADP